jgi:hypothetical protein
MAFEIDTTNYEELLNLENVPVTTPRDILKALRCMKYSDIIPLLLKKKMNIIHRCAICLDNFKNDNYVIFLGCGHYFDKECISNWLLNNSKVCPICKKEVKMRPKKKNE